MRARPGRRRDAAYWRRRYAKTWRQGGNAVSEPWSNGQNEGQINKTEVPCRRSHSRRLAAPW